MNKTETLEKQVASNYKDAMEAATVAAAYAEENAKLRAFAQEIMEAWAEGSGLDGRQMQDVATKHGATTVCLIPARTNTGWFHDLCLSAAEVRFVKGRPKFGDADHGLPLPLAVVIYRPRYGTAAMTPNAKVSGACNEARHD